MIGEFVQVLLQKINQHLGLLAAGHEEAGVGRRPGRSPRRAVLPGVFNPLPEPQVDDVPGPRFSEFADELLVFRVGHGAGVLMIELQISGMEGGENQIGFDEIVRMHLC